MVEQTCQFSCTKMIDTGPRVLQLAYLQKKKSDFFFKELCNLYTISNKHINRQGSSWKFLRYLADKISLSDFIMGHNSEKQSDLSSKDIQVIYISPPISTPSFKALA